MRKKNKSLSHFGRNELIILGSEKVVTHPSIYDFTQLFIDESELKMNKDGGHVKLLIAG